MITNLTQSQKDYAIYLPAIGFYYTQFIGKQRYSEYVPYDRIPKHLTCGVESLNYLEPQASLWNYKWSLYSAGNANLDTTKTVVNEDQTRNRDRNNSWLLGDSGGFQIASGKWPGDWRKGSNCAKAELKREQVLTWLDTYMDYGIILDIPTWVMNSPETREATGITSFKEALDATVYNNEYFINNRNGNCKFLNVIQGGNYAESDSWYESVKHFCDPKQFPGTHFNGWAFGNQNCADIQLVLKRLVTMIHDGLLQEGVHDLLHVLGVGKVEWGILLTTIQRAIRKYHNKNFTITMDSASPFLCTANGGQYTHNELEHNSKWKYVANQAPNTKDLAHDTQLWDTLCKQLYKEWNPSPVTQGLRVNEVCIKKPGDLNGNGKESKTAWDNFSYCLLMNHNVYSHIRSIQIANELQDQGLYPASTVNNTFDTTSMTSIINQVFACKNKQQALDIIEYNQKLWLQTPGSMRSKVGVKTINATTQFNALFD